MNLIMHSGLRNYAEDPTAHLEGTSELHFQREEVLLLDPTMVYGALGWNSGVPILSLVSAPRTTYMK